MNQSKNTSMKFPIFIVFLTLFVQQCLLAQPNANTKQVINGSVVYQDKQYKTVFYHVPKGLKLVKNAEGKPHFKFIQMRYTGTRLTGDQGSYRFKSLVQFKVAQELLSKQQNDSIKTELDKQGYVVTSLKPLPISNLKAELIHAADNAQDSSYVLSGGFFEDTEAEAQVGNWKERDYTMRLNNHDAQAFWNSFQDQQPTLSVNYTFFAQLFAEAATDLESTGSSRFDEVFEAEKDSDSLETVLQETIVNAGVIPIYIDTQKWPDLITQVDINEQIPPDYAALDLYCFDFNNNIREDLYAKRIEIKATSVGGKTISVKKIFKSTSPELYAQTIQFVNAVKLNLPYFYQVTEIFQDGSYTKSNWQENTSWTEILDITTTSTPK